MESFLYHYSYLAVFVLSFISAMGLPVGAELAVIGGGALASGEVHMLLPNGQTSPEVFHASLAAVILLAVLGEVLGSLAGYLIGFYGGRPGGPLRTVCAALAQGPRPGGGLVRPARRTAGALRALHPAAPFVRVVRRRAR